MAWRSLARNRKRSAVTATGIALAMAMCMATLGLMDGLSLDLIRGTTDGEVGHVQIHHPEYLGSRRATDSVAAGAQELQALRGHPLVSAASSRLYAWGYLSSPAGATGVQLMGIEPDHEAKVTRVRSTVIDGEFVPAAPTPWAQPQALSAQQQALDRKLTEAAIDDAFAQIERGAGARAATAVAASAQSAELAERLAPRPNQPPAAVLGAKLAANLGVGTGGRVHLLYENTLGAQSSLELRVVGIFRTGLDATDRNRVLLHTEDLQKMLLLGGRAHEIAVRLHDPRAADAAATALATLPAGDGPRQVQSWSQVRPDIMALIASNQALMGSLVFLVFVIAGTGVLNTMLVSVTERQKEISLMKALGQAPRKITALILLETLLLACAACAAGLVLGGLGNLYLKEYGIDVSGFGGFSMSGVNMAPVLRASLTLDSALVPLFCLLVVALLAAWMPARMAARLAPAAVMGGRS
jgi:ABC-type lipoprotein release transport system permease subunit